MPKRKTVPFEDFKIEIYLGFSAYYLEFCGCAPCGERDASSKTYILCECPAPRTKRIAHRSIQVFFKRAPGIRGACAGMQYRASRKKSANRRELRRADF